MNLSAYDIINNVNYETTWINTTYKKLYSKEYKGYKYYVLLSRYNNHNNDYDFYICLYKTITPSVKPLKIDIDGRTIKIPLSNIWDKCSFKHETRRTFNISPDIIEQDDEHIILGIDL